MIALGPTVARVEIRAPRGDVWNFLVEADHRNAWWPELQLGSEIHTRVSERWTESAGDTSVTRDASGEIDVWVHAHALGFTWKDGDDEHSTAVLITLRSLGDSTGVTVTETGFDAFEDGAERAAASKEGWTVLLRDLATAAEAATHASPISEPEPEPEPEPEVEPERAEAESTEQAQVNSKEDPVETDTVEIDTDETDTDETDTDETASVSVDAAEPDEVHEASFDELLTMVDPDSEDRP